MKEVCGKMKIPLNIGTGVYDVQVRVLLSAGKRP